MMCLAKQNPKNLREEKKNQKNQEAEENIYPPTHP